MGTYIKYQQLRNIQSKSKADIVFGLTWTAVSHIVALKIKWYKENI